MSSIRTDDPAASELVAMLCASLRKKSEKHLEFELRPPAWERRSHWYRCRGSCARAGLVIVLSRALVLAVLSRALVQALVQTLALALALAVVLALALVLVLLRELVLALAVVLAQEIWG